MDSEIQSLQKALTELGDEFNQKVQHLERRIDVLVSKQELSKQELSEIIEPNASVAEQVVSPQVSKKAKSDFSRDVSHTPRNPVKTQSKNSLFSGLISLFTPVFAMLLGPFSGLLEQFSSLYQHYQKQGKAPVFFMTLTGVVALVFGFGYLLQYSFNEYLGPIGKVVIGFVIAFATTGGGVWFTKNKQEMAEYGSSIIALGVVLSYLCAYFAGPYYGVLPDFLGFLLLVAVTAIAYVLALLFETRVVAIVTLVGGAAMPLVMGHVDQSPQLYLSYLLVLTCAMLHLSQRIHWQPLAYVAMLLSAAMVEVSVNNREMALSLLEYAEPYGLIVILHGFFYAFAFYALEGLSRIVAMDRVRLTIITANIVFYLALSQQLIASSVLLGVIYLLNIVPWLVLFILPRKVFRYTVGSDEFRVVQALALLHAGLLMGLGILVLSSPDLMGLIWCVEALLLVYLGSKFQFVSVRVEGYIALLISFVAMAFQIAVWVLDSVEPVPTLLALDMNIGWVNLIAVTALIYCALVLLSRQVMVLTDKERSLKLLLSNLFSVCLSLSFLLTVGIFWAQGMWMLAIVPMFYLIWRSRQQGLFFTELFGLSHLLLIAIPVIVSSSVAGNFHFSEQSIYGQIARIEAFVSLWLIAEFYKRFFHQSTNFGFTENLRKLFYCIIPVFFLPSVLRQHAEYFPLVLWASSAIALLLYYRLQFTVLKFEVRLLVVAASVASVGGCWLVEYGDWQGRALEALLAGLAFYVFIGWLGQGLRRAPLGTERHKQRHWALKPLFTVAVYYVAIALFIVLYGISSNVNLSMLVVLVYFVGVYFYHPVLTPIRSNLQAIYGIVFLLFTILTYNHVNAVFGGRFVFGATPVLLTAALNVMAAFCVALLVHRKSAQNRAVWCISGGQILHAWLFNLVTIVVYVSLSAQIFSNMLGPVISFVLVAHATIILFQTIKPPMKKLIWLSVMLYGVAALKVLLWDMNDFSLVQKIVVFMLIGLCMLGAAFKFQKVMVDAVER
ncbi:hypothetical protein A9Q81_01110 [Gammaproteobacteria bacterium 42_54_T18]|nr:hypothetical protein A9Q81_01110 [Gammaproteobacteria bacterium 42_54_T18]